MSAVVHLRQAFILRTKPLKTGCHPGHNIAGELLPVLSFLCAYAWCEC